MFLFSVIRLQPLSQASVPVIPWSGSRPVGQVCYHPRKNGWCYSFGCFSDCNSTKRLWFSSGHTDHSVELCMLWWHAVARKYEHSEHVSPAHIVERISRWLHQLTITTSSETHHSELLAQTTILEATLYSKGYSFDSFHYPYHTIVINLRVNIYVRSLSLGPQSNVERFGLRLYNPDRNVDDTYYSSRSPQYYDRPTVTGIPLAKVALRLYINLYTTSDGLPPRDIKLLIVRISYEMNPSKYLMTLRFP